jgi:hypothetical protein
MSILDGIIEIDLDGESVELRPTPQAALKLSQTFGGLFPIIGRIRQLDLDAFVAVVQYGGGIKQTKDLPEKVFSSGMTTLAPALIDFITVLANGGKMPNFDAEETPTEGKD